MEKIEIQGLYGKSVILIGESIKNVGNYLPNAKIYIITDKNVQAHQGENFPTFPTYCISPGEGSKTLEVAAKIYTWLLDEDANRHSFILGIGGGVVCDLAGFVASTFMRGIPFGFVATSLLAQVDASVGGKNGVNLDGYKNTVGTFTQPSFVICDIEALSTLPREEFSNGFAEIVKHTLIADAQMFDYIEENIETIKKFNPEALEQLVSHSVRIKAGIVQSDEREGGVRKTLNLGHSWGHAVEKITNLPHGKSVSIGIEFAARLSTTKGFLTKKDYIRIANLLLSLGLPVCVNVNPQKIFEIMVKDKKRTGSCIEFILLNGIGNVKIVPLSLDEISTFIHPESASE